MVEVVGELPFRETHCPHCQRTVRVLSADTFELISGHISELEHVTTMAASVRQLSVPEGWRYAIADHACTWTCPACERAVYGDADVL